VSVYVAPFFYQSFHGFLPDKSVMIGAKAAIFCPCKGFSNFVITLIKQPKK
jgi:hypothetical protein